MSFDPFDPTDPPTWRPCRSFLAFAILILGTIVGSLAGSNQANGAERRRLEAELGGAG